MAQLDCCEITAYPASVWRRLLWDIIPYWQSSRQGFILSIELRPNFGSRQRFMYRIQYSNTQRTKPEELGVSNLRVGYKNKYALKKLPLLYTGDTFLIVADSSDITPSEKPGKDPYQTVYSFHTTSRSWLALAVVAGIFAGAISALIGLITC